MGFVWGEGSGMRFLGPFDLISNSPWNCSTDTWCAAGILLKLGLGAWLDQRPACPSIKMKKSKLSHWTWEIEWEECHFSFETEQKLSHSDEHLLYNPVTQSTKIVKLDNVRCSPAVLSPVNLQLIKTSKLQTCVFILTWFAQKYFKISFHLPMQSKNSLWMDQKLDQKSEQILD